MIGVGVGVGEERQDLFVRPSLDRLVLDAVVDGRQRAQQDRHRDRALAVELEGQVVALARLEFHPGAAVGDELGGRQPAPGEAVLGGFEVHARTADELGDDHTLGPVDDEGALLGHQREVAEEDVVLDRVRHFRPGQQNRDVERRGEGQIALDAFLDVMFGIFEPDT